MARFQATLIASGNATAIEVPADVLTTLGAEARPPVEVAINGYRWRTRVAAMRGMPLIGISAAQRAAAGITEGEMVEIDVTRDDAPRDVAMPDDLASALDASGRAAFERLAFGLRQKHVREIEAAKSAAVRQRRIERLVATLGAG